MELSRDAQSVEDAARVYWACATSENRVIAAGDGAVYKSARKTVKTLVMAVYEMSDYMAEKVMDILSELGPDDSHIDSCPGEWGMRSYVSGVNSRRYSR